MLLTHLDLQTRNFNGKTVLTTEKHGPIFLVQYPLIIMCHTEIRELFCTGCVPLRTGTLAILVAGLRLMYFIPACILFLHRIPHSNSLVASVKIFTFLI